MGLDNIIKTIGTGIFCGTLLFSPMANAYPEEMPGSEISTLEEQVEDDNSLVCSFVEGYGSGERTTSSLDLALEHAEEMGYDPEMQRAYIIGYGSGERTTSSLDLALDYAQNQDF